MKEPITKFDLEAAFKALDELEIPKVAQGIKANKPALTEIFSRKSKFESLFEEYYDVGNPEELTDAKEAREAEVAKAKLARIEKIVDLEAESPEDLLTSYVGKFIIQCPQCMTLFYKDQEDIEESEEDPNTVNVNETCQHCGNESGYTLIGKVDEATPEETEELTAEIEDSLDLEVIPDEDVSEETSEESEEDALDLDNDLDELDLEIEDDETEEKPKTEESLSNTQENNSLLEQLNEETDLEVSASEFEELINLPEFKKPVSDKAARVMMQELTDDEDLDEGIFSRKNKEKTIALGTLDKGDRFSKDGFKYRIVRIDGDQEDFTVQPYGKKNPNDVLNSMGYVLMSGSDSVVKLTEGIQVNGEIVKYVVINSDGTYAGVPCTSEEEARELAAQKEGRIIVELGSLKEGIFDKLKDKFADAVDNITSKLKSREAKADWILANAMEDYNNVQMSTVGKLVPDEKNQRFHTFIVIGYKETYSNGKLITQAPSFNNKDLVIGMNRVETKTKYKDADNIAKGWSMRQGNGPAFIYLAKNADDEKAVFLCEYFKGELEYDQLDKYFEVVKKDLKAAKLMRTGGMNQSSEETDETKDTENTVESLNKVLSGLEEIQEESLEKLITDSLVEMYKNVAGFRLNECTYLNEALSIHGKIFLTSGKTKNTVYTFTEAKNTKDNKIILHGINEDLGLDRQFVLIGDTKKINRTFIAESFSYSSKKE